MKAIADSLAAQMTAAGITPDNVTAHPAYINAGGLGLLRYGLGDDRRPVLGEHACSLRQDGPDWLLWDDHGATFIRLSYDGGAWGAR